MVHSDPSEPRGGEGKSRRAIRNRHDAARATGPALEAMYQLVLWLVPTLEKFPRSQKFLLGDRLQGQALAVLDHLIAATYTRDRAGHLRAANLDLERLRFGIRLAHDLQHLDIKRYEYLARALDDVGRLVGGWLKTHSVGVADTAESVAAEQGAHATPA
jgi:hypothetical protein